MVFTKRVIPAGAMYVGKSEKQKSLHRYQHLNCAISVYGLPIPQHCLFVAIRDTRKTGLFVLCRKRRFPNIGQDMIVFVWFTQRCSVEAHI